jgi:hypothetical protein
MEDSLFIDDNYLKQYSPLGKSIDVDEIYPFVSSAQDVYIQDVLGTPLYMAPEIVKKCNEYLSTTNIKIKLTEPRLRKIVNYIRTNSLLPLIATSSGYYVSNDRMEIINQIESLEQRANSIARCALGLKNFIK